MTATVGACATRDSVAEPRLPGSLTATVLGAALALMALVALVGCGPGEPARIALPAGATPDNPGFAANRSAELWMEPVEFVLAAGVDLPASRAPGWRYTAPSDTDVADLAARLGVPGTPRVVPATDGGGWEVGGGDDEASLFVAPGGSWWASESPTAGISISSPDCDPDTPVSTREVPGDDGDTVDVIVIEGPGGCDDATTPVPAPELPGDAEVADAAAAIFGADATVEPEVRDDWYVSVRANYLIDGEPSGHVGHYGVGAGGWDASGLLGTAGKEGPYRTLSAADAAERLGGAIAGGPLPETPMPDTPMPAPDNSPEPGAPEPGGDAAIPGAEPGDPGDSVDPAPAPDVPGPVEPGPVEVVLVGVTTRLVPFTDGFGTVWSLPGYTYIDDTGNNWEVVAVAPEFFDAPAADPGSGALPPGAGDSGAPGVVGPGDGAGDDPGDDVLPGPGPPPPPVEGLSEEDATAALMDAGYEVRVVERNGEQFQMTMDYRDNRVNLVITNDVVTSATIG